MNQTVKSMFQDFVALDKQLAERVIYEPGIGTLPFYQAILRDRSSLYEMWENEMLTIDSINRLLLKARMLSQVKACTQTERMYQEWFELNEQVVKKMKQTAHLDCVSECRKYIMSCCGINRDYDMNELTYDRLSNLMMQARRILAIDHIGTNPIRAIYTPNRSHEEEDAKRWYSSEWYTFHIDLRNIHPEE